MARPRRNYTLDPDTVAAIEAHADAHHNGNQSQAIEALVKTGLKAQRRDTIQALQEAGIGTAALLLIFTVGMFLV